MPSDESAQERAALGAAAPSKPPSPGVGPATAGGPARVAVLMVGRGPCGLAHDRSMLPDTGHPYEVVSLGSDADAAAIGELLESAPPRLVVADIRWCETVGSPSLRRLRQLAPATGWLVCWPSPEPQWLPLLLDCGALGALSCGDSPQERLRALDTVCAGQLWLPRKVLQWLYTALLDSGFASQRSVDAAARLTPRETEAIALMHQGLSNRQIGERLGVSINTVKKHLGNGFEKLGIQKRRQVLG